MPNWYLYYRIMYAVGRVSAPRLALQDVLCDLRRKSQRESEPPGLESTPLCRESRRLPPNLRKPEGQPGLTLQRLPSRLAAFDASLNLQWGDCSLESK
jgi:hypothetical protein